MADVSDYGTLCAVCGKFVSCTATKYEGFGFLHEPCAEEIRTEIAVAFKESTKEMMRTFMDGFLALTGGSGVLAVIAAINAATEGRVGENPQGQARWNSE